MAKPVKTFEIINIRLLCKNEYRRISSIGREKERKLEKNEGH